LAIRAVSLDRVRRDDGEVSIIGVFYGGRDYGSLLRDDDE
jgi:hypothetical protein